jgi:hypothetical protein
MPRRRKKAMAVPFNAADVANIAKANPYIQRLIEDANLRDNVRTVLDSSKSLYERLSNGKAPAKALFEDKKVQAELRSTVDAIRDAASALSDAPKKKARKGMSFGRKVMILGLGGGLAMVGSEKIRSKVLDTLFGAEEEFEYTPPAAATQSEPATPVSATT